MRKFGDAIVADMRALWIRRKDVGARATAVRTHAEKVAAAHGAALLTVAIDMQFQHEDENLCMYVEYQGIDVAMRDGRVLDFFPGRDELDDTRLRAPAGISYRRDQRRELESVGADGWIDGMAAAVAAAAPQGLQAVLATMGREYETTFRIPTSGAPMFATLFWKDGEIEAEISVRGCMDFLGNRLELRGASIPASIVAALPERTVDAVVALPFACPIRIEEVEEFESGIRLRLKSTRSLVNCSASRIWEAPKGME